ncbi:hypothetical protein QBC43DRAFT_213679 [Cladorrhinum sp. PSN259]|nr:hypothetical protein QBC43DRAFT_213679 [Cladorrhinum sp. PSN259]
MLFRNSHTILASLVATSQLVVAQSTINTDVVIIGGGSAGTYGAVSLQDQGVDVVVIEKQSDLGGHAETYTDPTTGQKVNAGVQVFHNLPIVTEYAARLGVPLGPVGYDGINSSTLNIPTGQYVSDPTLNPGFPAAFGKYIQIYMTNYAYLNSGLNLPNPVPEDLLLPFGDFARKHQIEPVVFLFNLFTQGWDISKVPTVYVMVTVNLDLANNIAANSLIGASDTNDLYRSASTILGPKVLYNANVFLVQRSSTGVTVKVMLGNTIKTIKAKKLLMAAPPTLDNLLGWDLSVQELRLFSKLRGYGYYAGVVSNPSFPENTTIRNAVASTSNFQLPNLPMVFTLSYTPLPNKARVVNYATQFNLSKELAAAACVNDLNNMVSRSGMGNGKTKLHAWYAHGPYNLQVTANDIKNGYYSDLFGLQGQKNTYWTGATFRAQDSTMVWGYTKSLLSGITNGL